MCVACVVKVSAGDFPLHVRESLCDSTGESAH